MIVKAKYYKEIEVIDDISKEEIDRICQYGMPDRFDCMADDIDNEKPLEFDSWEFVEDTYYKPYTPPNIIKEKPKKSKKSLLANILAAIIFASVFGVAWGIGRHSVLIGLVNFIVYLIVYVPVTITVNWIRKVNKYMEGDRSNV